MKNLKIQAMNKLLGRPPKEQWNKECQNKIGKAVGE